MLSNSDKITKEQQQYKLFMLVPTSINILFLIQSLIKHERFVRVNVEQNTVDFLYWITEFNKNRINHYDSAFSASKGRVNQELTFRNRATIHTKISSTPIDIKFIR